MAISQERSKRKISGGRYKDYRKKKFQALGSLPTLTVVNENKIKIKRVKSGSLKFTLLASNKANVYNSKTKKYAITDIITVADNPANRNYVRRNIMTKGTIVETKLGKARITSRPGQEGTINAILI